MLQIQSTCTGGLGAVRSTVTIRAVVSVNIQSSNSSAQLPVLRASSSRDLAKPSQTWRQYGARRWRVAVTGDMPHHAAARVPIHRTASNPPQRSNARTQGRQPPDRSSIILPSDEARARSPAKYSRCAAACSFFVFGRCAAADHSKKGTGMRVQPHPRS